MVLRVGETWWGGEGSTSRMECQKAVYGFMTCSMGCTEEEIHNIYLDAVMLLDYLM